MVAEEISKNEPNYGIDAPVDLQTASLAIDRL